MYLDDPRSLRSCFRCGEIGGEYILDEGSGVAKCGSCGEHGVVSLIQALDLLNELHAKGMIINVEDIEEAEDDDYYYK